MTTSQKTGLVKQIESPELRQIFVFLGVLGFLAISLHSVCGLSLKDSIISTLYMAITSFAGAIIWPVIANRKQVSIEELVAMGMFLGSASIALINIIYRYFSLRAPVASLAICVLALGAYCFKTIPRVVIVDLNLKTTIWNTQLLFCCVLGYLSTLSNYIFPYFFASTIAYALYRITQKIEFFQLPIYLIAMTAGWFITNFNKNINMQNYPYWSWVGNDAIYDTSYSVGIGRFGIRDNILYSSHSSKGYLLTYSWAGEFANVTRINQLSISTVSFAVFGLLGIGFIALAIGKFLYKSILAAQLSVILIFCQALFPEPFLLGEYLKLNNTISLMWLLCLVYTILLASKSSVNKPLLLITIIIPIVAYGKFHFGIVAILFSSYLFDFRLCFLNLKQLRFVDLIKQSMVVLLPVLATVIVFYFLINFPNRWPYSFNFDFWILSNVALLFSFRFIGLRLNVASELNSYNRTSNIIVILSLAYYLYSMGANNSIYLVSAAVVISAFALAGVIQQVYEKFERLDKYFVLMISSLISVTSFMVSRDHAMNYWRYLKFPSMDFKQDVFVNHQYLVMPLIFICFGILLSFLASSRRFRKFLREAGLLPITVISIFSMNFGFFMAIPMKSLILNSKYEAGIQQNFPIDAEIQEAGQFIRDNTSRLSIVASNRICIAELPLSMKTPGWPPGTMPECGNLNFLTSISAISERRQFLEAPAFENTIGPFLPPDAFERYKTLLAVFLSPNSSNINSLQKSGVNILLLDRELEYSPYIFNFGNIIFENQKITLLSI